MTAFFWYETHTAQESDSQL